MVKKISYFITNTERKSILHLYFKSEIISDEEMHLCFQTAKRVSRIKNGIITDLDVIFKLPEKEFLLIWKNVVKSEKIHEILSQYLPGKQKNTAINQSGIMTIEAHRGH